MLTDFKEYEYAEAIPEVCLRTRHPGKRMGGSQMLQPKDVADFSRYILEGETAECVIMFTLGTDCAVINWSLIARGVPHHCQFNVADIARTCLLSGSSACIVVHNHTSYSQSDKAVPSEDDIECCEHIHKALLMQGIVLTEFLIVGPPGEKECSFFVEKLGPYKDR